MARTKYVRRDSEDAPKGKFSHILATNHDVPHEDIPFVRNRLRGRKFGKGRRGFTPFRTSKRAKPDQSAKSTTMAEFDLPFRLKASRSGALHEEPASFEADHDEHGRRSECAPSPPEAEDAEDLHTSPIESESMWTRPTYPLLFRRPSYSAPSKRRLSSGENSRSKKSKSGSSSDDAMISGHLFERLHHGLGFRDRTSSTTPLLRHPSFDESEPYPTRQGTSLAIAGLYVDDSQLAAHHGQQDSRDMWIRTRLRQDSGVGMMDADICTTCLGSGLEEDSTCLDHHIRGSDEMECGHEV